MTRCNAKLQTKGPRKRAFRLHGLSSTIAFAESMNAGAMLPAAIRVWCPNADT
jgi:hypothetical protein